SSGMDVRSLETQRGHALECLAWMDILHGHPERAVALLSEAVAIEEHNVEVRHGDALAQQDLVDVLSDLGYALLRARRFGDAVLPLQRASAITEQILARDPQNRAWGTHACFAYAWLGASLAGAERKSEAHDRLVQVLAVAEPLFDQPKSGE